MSKLKINALRHSIGSQIAEVPATCTSTGTKAHYKCTREGCNTYFEDAEGNTVITDLIIPINDNAHDWGEWQTTPATCTEDGEQTRTCKTNSEHKETQTISALGHDYTKKIIPPTPEKLGGTLYTCTRCSDQYYDNYTMMHGTHPSKMPDDSPITKSAVPKAKNEIEVNGETITMILQDPLGVLVKNKSDDLRLDSVYVEEGSDRHKELMANLDPTYSVENIQFYEIVPYVNGEKKSGELENMVRILYKIPKGWDREDMEAVLVGEGKDLEFDEKLEVIDGEYYLVLWTNHFSPYSFIDTLSEEEKEALNQDNKPNSENNTDGINYIVTEETDTENSEQIEDNSVSNQINTGYDNTHKMLILSSILITSGLFLEIFIKKKLKV